MAAGSIARVLPYQVVHYVKAEITYSDDGSAVSLGTIPAESVILPSISGVNVSTAFNDSGTDLIDIGTSADADLYATDLDGSSAGFIALDESVSLYVSSDTELTVTYAGQNSDASAGAAQVIVAYVPLSNG